MESEESLGTDLHDLHELVSTLRKLTPTEKHCSNSWTENYSKFHRENVAKDTPKLIFIPNISGLADRIIGLTTSLLLAVLTNRVFQIGNRSVLLSLDILFNAPNIDWMRQLDEEWLIEPLRDSADIINYNETILAEGKYSAINSIRNDSVVAAIAQSDVGNVLGNSKNVFLVLNRGKTVAIFSNENYRDKLTSMNLTQYSTFGCLVNYLFSPKPEIFIPVLPQLRALIGHSTPTSIRGGTDAWPTLRIGIQIRVGDHLMASADEAAIGIAKFQYYFDCASEIESFARLSLNQTVVWYLITDSIHVRQQAAEKFGEKIITSLNSTIEHSAKEFCGGCKVSHEGFKAAAAEWYMFGLCDYFVISLMSGYGRSAAFRSLRQNSIYTVVNHGPTQCGQRSFNDVDFLGRSWSGI